jgi:hypothetical protein
MLPADRAVAALAVVVQLTRLLATSAIPAPSA